MNGIAIVIILKLILWKKCVLYAVLKNFVIHNFTTTSFWEKKKSKGYILKEKSN